MLMLLMDSLSIHLNSSLPSASKMPNSLDIGLNFIKRKERKLVPTLVRLPLEYETIGNLYKEFKRLEISTDAL